MKLKLTFMHKIFFQLKTQLSCLQHNITNKLSDKLSGCLFNFHLRF